MTSSDNRESARETIILVHGTFAEPRSEGPKQWYQPGSEFCRDLDARLEKLDCSARCWAHLADDSSYFFWSGRNDWIARSAGAADLARLMHTLIDDDWRVHVVAHSHGGNVLLEALDVGAEGFAAAHNYENGYLVLIGTPVMEMRELAKGGMSHGTVAKKVLLSTAILAMLVWLAWPPSDYLLRHIANTLLGDHRLIEIAIVASTFCFALLTVLYLARLLLYRVMGLRSSMGSIGPSPHTFIPFRDALSTQWKRLLILNSDVDEAYQVLSRLAGMVPEILKPAAIDLGSPNTRRTAFREWLGGILSLSHYADQMNFGERRTGISGFTALVWAFQALAFIFVMLIGILITLLIDRLIGLGILALLCGFTLLSLFRRKLLAFLCIPVRILSFLKDVFLSGLLNCATWTFRRWGGYVIRDIILGVSGFPFADRHAVSLVPKSVGEDFYEFRNLPDEVVRQALDRRSKDVVSWLDALTRLLSDQVIAADDALPILKRIANDTTLIHASYYQADICRQEIAEWLARDLAALEAESREYQLL